VLPTAAADLFPRAALAFAAAHPGAALRAETGPNGALIEALRGGELDLVVGRMAAPEAMRGLTFEQLRAEEVALVCRPAHPLARAGRMVGADCADWPLILPPEGAAIHGTVRAWLTAAGIGRARALFETVSPAFGRRAVELSDALWFISSGVVAEDLGAGRLAALPLRGPMLAGPIGISLREDATPPIELDALLAALRRVAREEEP
jgi:LysR family pca operon transcriptional activator